MATATLINVATPGPALNYLQANGSQQDAGIFAASGFGGWQSAAITMTTASTVYSIGSIIIPSAGTWALFAEAVAGTTGVTGVFLNTAPATGSNSWPVSGFATAFKGVAVAVIKTTGALTVYLNATHSVNATIAQATMNLVQTT